MSPQTESIPVSAIMSTHVETIRSDAAWDQVAHHMLGAGVSGLPVVDDDGYMLGIVSEGDLISRPASGERAHPILGALADLLAGDLALAGKATATTAAELMTTAVITAVPEEDVRTVAERMRHHRLKRLPVVDAGRLVGMISRSDLIRCVLDQHQVKL